MAKQYGKVDAGVLQASKSLQAGKMSQNDFNKIVHSGTDGLTKFASGLKNVAFNMGIMLAATLAIKAAIYVIDELYVSFEEQQQIVDDLASSIEDLKSEYDQLKADPSASGVKLSYLKKQIDYQQDLLDIERERLALKYIDEKVPEFGEEDDGVSGGHVNATITPEDTVEVDIQNNMQKLQQAREQLAKVEDDTNGWFTGTWVNQEQESLKALSANVETLKTEYLELAKSRDTIQQYLDDGYYKGANADMAREEVARIQTEIDRLDPIILEAELELGTANYLEAYNKILDDISDKQSHMRSTDYAHVQTVDGEKDLKDVIKVEQLDNLIAKNKELNQSFLDGEITSKKYFDSINKLITDSGLENAVAQIEDWSTERTDYLEEAVSVLSAQVADSMMESEGRFVREESSVREYVDDLKTASQAEMKMLKATYRLTDAQEGQVEATEKSAEGADEAAEAYNDMQKQLEELSEVDGLLDVQTQYADLVRDMENLTTDMLDSTQVQNYISDMSVAIANFAKDNESTIQDVASRMSTILGKQIDTQKLLSEDASTYIAGVMGENVNNVINMSTFANQEIGNVVQNTKTSIGGVFSKLAELIQNFDFTIAVSLKDFSLVKKKVGILGKEFEVHVPQFTLDINGSGGEKVQEFANVLSQAGETFTSEGIGDMIATGDYYGGGKTNTNGSPSLTDLDSPVDDSKGGGSSSTKDPHIVEVDAYKNLTDAVSEYDRKLEKLERTYDDTDSIQERIGLKKAEIKLYQEQKDAIDALNKARDEEISGLVNKLRGVGFQIDYDPTTENLLIKNREHINDLNQSIIEEYEEMVERVDELNDANKDSADQWDELTSSIVKAGKELKDLEKEKYEDYIEGAEHVLRLMENRKDAFGKESAVYTNMMNATLKRWKDLVTTDYEGNIEEIREREEAWMDFYDARIEKEKEILEMQLDDNDRVLDGVIKVIDDQIKALDDQIDGLSKANDERKKALELQKAQAELDKQRNQKTRHVLRKGQGWVWEADDDAIKEAEENLSDLEYESKTDALEKEKEALEDLKEKWEEIPDIAEDEQNRLLMIEKLGADAEEDILNDRIDVYEDFKDDYIDIQEQIQDKTDELEKHTSAAYLNVVKAFENMAKLAGIGLDTGAATQTTQSSWYVNKDGKAPSQAQVGDTILTKGGTYRILGKDENGKFISEKIDDISHDIKDGMWGTEVQNVSNTIKSIYDELKELQKGGSVDLLNRPEVSSKIMQKAGWDTEDGSISTVNTSTYSNRDGSVAMNFTPIQVDKNGKLVRVLSEDELQRYAEDVIDGVHNDYLGLKIGGTFTGKNAIANAELDAQRIHELHEALTKDETGENVVDSVEDIIRINEDLVDKTKKQILTDANLQKYIEDNSKYTSEEIVALLDNSDVTDMLADYTDDNSDATDDNTDAIYDWIDALNNFELNTVQQQILVDEELSNALAKFDDSTMSPEDQAYLKEIQKAWNTAKAQGNQELMDELHAMADAVREQYINGTLRPLVDGKDYNRIGSDGYSSVFHENSRSDAYGGAPVTGIVGSTTSIWGLDSTDPDEVQKAIDRGWITEEESKNLVQLSGGRYNSDGSKKVTTNTGKDLSDTSKWKSEEIRSNTTDSGNGTWTTTRYTNVETGETITKTDYEKNRKATTDNTSSLNDNTDSNNYSGDSSNYAGDASYDVADATKDNTSSNKDLKSSVDELNTTVKNADFSSGSTSSGGSSDGSGGGGGSDPDSKIKEYNRILSKGNWSDSYTKSLKNAIANEEAKKKKAKGGLNLPEDTYNTHEKGDEIIIDKPDEGNWVRINTGGSVIPHEVSAKLWEFGANPKMFLSDVLGYDAMKMNQQIIYTGSGEKVIQYHIGSINPTLPNVTKPDEFWDEFTRNLPNEAKQWSSTGY